eukprot:scaffold172_cov254-Pinguiococcus_pyrenoidosus.AAC.40
MDTPFRVTSSFTAADLVADGAKQVMDLSPVTCALVVLPSKTHSRYASSSAGSTSPVSRTTAPFPPDGPRSGRTCFTWSFCKMLTVGMAMLLLCEFVEKSTPFELRSTANAPGWEQLPTLHRILASDTIIGTSSKHVPGICSRDCLETTLSPLKEDGYSKENPSTLAKAHATALETVNCDPSTVSKLSTPATKLPGVAEFSLGSGVG